MKLRIGGFYVARNGEVAEIMGKGIDVAGEFYRGRFFSDPGRASSRRWGEDGSVLSGGGGANDRDLVKEITLSLD